MAENFEDDLPIAQIEEEQKFEILYRHWRRGGDERGMGFMHFVVARFLVGNMVRGVLGFSAYVN